MSATEQIPAGTPVGHQGVRVHVHERPALQLNGFLGLLLALVLAVVAAWAFTRVPTDDLGGATSGTRRGFLVLGVVLLVLAIVVLCGDSRATPVVNTGTLYS
jgi:hypothetical protein